MNLLIFIKLYSKKAFFVKEIIIHINFMKGDKKKRRQEKFFFQNSGINFEKSGL